MGEESTSRGQRIRAWLWRKSKRLGIQVAIAIILGLSVRAAVAEAFYVTSDVVAPEVPRYSRVVVYKLTTSFNPGDIIVYRDRDGLAMLGRVSSTTDSDIIVGRARDQQTVPRKTVVGRVVLGTR